MCAVSMVGDYYTDKWKNNPSINRVIYTNISDVSKVEFDALKKDVAELKKDVLEALELLKRAKKYDEETNQPHCEMEEKVELLKKIADIVGVDLSEVFPNKG